jgi:hypothetical protein
MQPSVHVFKQRFELEMLMKIQYQKLRQKQQPFGIVTALLLRSGNRADKVAEHVRPKFALCLFPLVEEAHGGHLRFVIVGNNRDKYRHTGCHELSHPVDIFLK